MTSRRKRDRAARRKSRAATALIASSMGVSPAGEVSPSPGAMRKLREIVEEAELERHMEERAEEKHQDELDREE